MSDARACRLSLAGSAASGLRLVVRLGRAGCGDLLLARPVSPVSVGLVASVMVDVLRATGYTVYYDFDLLN